MKITDIRIRPGDGDRLLAFASVTFDNELAIHDIRIVDGKNGMFLSMPSRKLGDRCPQCGWKNDLKNQFCGGCGFALAETETRAVLDEFGKPRLYADVVHPVSDQFRCYIEDEILDRFDEYETHQKGVAS